MPRIIPFRLAAACALALAVSLTIASGAGASGFSAELRVVGAHGRILVERPFTTATTSISTSPKATCFGPGTGGDGKSVSIPGGTALGLLARASKSTPALRPLRISDHFDFGLALCGVGSSVATGKASWYLKVNHRALSVGGEKARIHAGDEVLWDLAPSFPYPDELEVVAPRAARAGRPFTVRVFSYDEKGKRTPAAGAAVSGASGPTDSRGMAKVTLSRPARLLARLGTDIPDRAAVCVGGKCPK